MSAPPEPTRQRALPVGTLLWLGGLLLGAFVLYVGWGTEYISPLRVVKELLRGIHAGESLNDVVWQIRLPRALGTICVGGLLATVGCAFQGLLRNPLADPYIVGVSSGAALGGVAILQLGLVSALGGLALPLAAFVGGLGSLFLVIALASGKGALDMRTLLLAGVVTGSMLSAILSLAIYYKDQDTTLLLRWLLGDTRDLDFPKVAMLSVVLLIGFVILQSRTRALNAFAIGESTALRLGVDTRRLKPIVLVTGAAMTAIAVGMVGIVGFVGLIAPHIARSLVGADWRRSMPVSLVLGALLLLVSDLVAQRLLASGEIPLGVVTAILGAPVLLVLLRKGT